MRHVTIGLLGNLEYTRELGKKSTESDIALYSYREGEVLVSVVAPIRYPEKPQSLSYAVGSADAALIVVAGLTRELGEQILAVDAAGIEKGVFVLQNYTQPEQIQPLIKGTSLEHFEFMEDKPPAVRAQLAKFAVKPVEGPVRIPIDHHFDVKGIGTVALGFVKQGVVKKHDALRAFPSDKVAQVRSIQVHDVDENEAGTGAHVGLALKNVGHEDLDRGQILAPEGTIEVVDAGKTVKLALRATKFFKAGIKEGGVYHLGAGMQFVNLRAKGTLAAGQEGEVEFEAQKPLAYDKGQRAVLFSLDNPQQRVVGGAHLPA